MTKSTAVDPRTIGGGLKAHGRERREELQMMIDSKPRNLRNDLLPELKLPASCPSAPGDAA